MNQYYFLKFAQRILYTEKWHLRNLQELMLSSFPLKLWHTTWSLKYQTKIQGLGIILMLSGCPQKKRCQRWKTKNWDIDATKDRSIWVNILEHPHLDKFFFSICLCGYLSAQGYKRGELFGNRVFKKSPNVLTKPELLQFEIWKRSWR